MCSPHLLLVLSLISCFNIVIFFLYVDAISISNNTGVWFELIHRHSHKLKTEDNLLGPPKNRSDRIRQLLESDNLRQQVIASQYNRKRRGISVYDGKETAEIPIQTGTDIRVAEYFVSFRIGSPRPQKFLLVADTGSDLTWMHCKYRCKGCPMSSPHRGRVFNGNDSPSFRTIPCSSKMCEDDLIPYQSVADCPSPELPCIFDYGYANGYRAIGIFANETVKVGLHSRLKIVLFNVVIGCTVKFIGDSKLDGVLGLGYSKHSFVVRLAEVFGNKFSYCLVDHLSPTNVRNYLSFGDVKHTKVQNMQYTELLLDYMNPYYCVNVSGISVDGKMLNIPQEVWNITGKGGVILDSGTSMTILAGAAHDTVVNAFKVALANFEKIEIPGIPVKHCFSTEGYNESLVPRLVFHFADGAKFQPPIKNYVIDVARDTKCLAFTSGGWPGTTIIGNILQQNHLWEFDLGRARLGYAPSSCIISDT
ncbi:aspartic proteinase NANA, chloroplast [Jatropha curcas]|uniref:aspartic proteinase NANA, chloroplast n=1 Tax=Jatropha curcas TaxID=180498 RepID=UPI0009D6F671|nr:aspartic proteinase NANA, chloroplast [Jatropha curcas]